MTLGRTHFSKDSVHENITNSGSHVFGTGVVVYRLRTAERGSSVATVLARFGIDPARIA